MDVKLGLIQKQSTTKSMLLKCGAMYRRMLRISWKQTTNIDVLQEIGVKETTMLNNLKNRKLTYAGHITL